jgi:CheY-like chemotaxis protein
MNFFRILYADDNSSLQWILKAGLTAYGFEVVTACHGLDA